MYDFGSKLDRLNEVSQMTIYRVDQESVTNIAKHAATATSVAICMQDTGSGVSVVIEDNGPGFDRTAQKTTRADGRSGGFGLVNMRERISLIGGGHLTSSLHPAAERRC
jgi:signal transduction histidine kinase